MSLHDLVSIKKPLSPLTLKNNRNDLVIQVIDYYRCLDTIDYDGEDEDDHDDHDDHDDPDGEGEDTDMYSKEGQKELSKTHNMLIKAFGILESGHSITINLQGFQPFFYIKIPDHWTSDHCRILTEHLRKAVYYRYKEHLVHYELVHRKPFTEFTGDDQFAFLKLQFKNKESYDQYSYKFANPLKVPGLNQDHPYKYDLYESNIEPIIKMIHLTGINPSGWIRLPKQQYTIIKDSTALTDVEVKIKWNQIHPHERLENVSINTMAFDIEADSSHGDFPIGIKNYQKLSQELITMYNEYGLQTKKTRGHPLLLRAPKQVLRKLLYLVFDDNFITNGIHQIQTLGHLKPHPSTLEQLVYTILQLYEQTLEGTNQESTRSEIFCDQLTDLFECNLPPVDVQQSHNSHYGLLAKEITVQLLVLTRNGNLHLKHHLDQVITMMLNLAFDDYFDGFLVSNIYTKSNLKPPEGVLEALIPDVYQILHDCACFIHFKKIPDWLTKEERDNLSQDFFVEKLTDLFNQHLPPVEGDRLIQIGSTFQLTGQTDCYLKHIICLGSCDPITNMEMIMYENKDIYLPTEELAQDLVMYELQLTGQTDVSKERMTSAVKSKIEEIKTWELPYRKSQCQKAAEYRRIKQSQTDRARVVVEFFEHERDVLLAWKQLVSINDPDVVIGYNIFGFDFKFLYDRATELDCVDEFCQLGRLKGFTELFYEQKLSSAGLGDNTLKYIPMTGRVVIDLYKVIQKDYRLDSYKLDRVCHKFLYKEKVDLPPREIFSLQKGTSIDRKKIATYCLVDCILCNRLVLKLEIISNNIAMANVCKVPFPYLFLRGQGVKIFSLVSDYCSHNGFLIPVLPKADPANDEKFEGAIVLPPDKGIHFDPVGVGDFNSLYPSSMISENVSHDSYVQKGGKYDNLPGYTYVDIEFDNFKTEVKPGTKKKIKRKIGTQVCRYAQLPGDKKSIIPTILMRLLAARKDAKNKMDAEEKDSFKYKIWNGLQLAYKITANSLYGQCGAKTSPIFKVEIAASTTAVGRRMITFSKKYVEENYKDTSVTLDLACTGIYNPSTRETKPTKFTGMTIRVKDSYCVYGDTDSVFIKFGLFTPEGVKITGLDAVSLTIAMSKKVTKEISSKLKKPQNIEFEKAIYPFILISKKRYHGHYYTKIDSPVFYANSMGIALKRRDNAPIVKHVLGGAIDIIMKDHDVAKSLEFTKDACQKLLKGQFPIEQFVISKTLRSYYKKPRQIAHNVLACRQAQRDPGNRFEPNDRVPYAFIHNPSKEALQGDRIETPDFIQQNKLVLDYQMYITNQIMKPVSQIFELVPGYEHTEQMFKQMMGIYESERTGQVSLTHFLKPRTQPSNLVKFSDLLKRQVVTVDELEDEGDTLEEEEETIEEDEDGEVEGTSNYEDPNF